MKLSFILLLISACVCIISAQKLKLCGYPSHQKACKQIDAEVGGKTLECILVQDSVDCALKIQDGKVDFGAFYPEQARLASQFINEDAFIVGEIRDEERKDNKHSYRTVVVVKSDHTGGINGIRGKSYCHFGFDTEDAMTKRAKQEFENILINIQENCDERSTSEKEVEQYAKYFSKACRPGFWVENSELDRKLKSKYPKLCELCDDASKCEYYKSSESTKKALECLTKKGAQVAYTTAEAVEKFVQEQPNMAESFKILCRNGDLKEIGTTIDDDCTWRNQPWTLILGKKDKASIIQNKLAEWIDPNYQINGLATRGLKRDSWQDALRKILTNDNEAFKFLFDSSNMKSPQEYFQQNKQELAEMKVNSKCDMKWCTINGLEQEKCQWLSTAMELQGIKTKMNCVTGKNTYDCFKKIREDRVDAMAIDSHYGYVARKYAHIRTLMNFEESSKDTSVIFAVIRSDSEITKFSDLRGKKACFPEYRGIAWLAFIQRARELKEIPDNCDFGKIIGDYFNDTCAPGVDEMHYKSAGANVKKLCSLCRSFTGEQGYCAADTTNKYFNNSGSLRCLTDSAAQVAFVELREIEETWDLQNMKLFCRDGSIKDIDLNNLDEECAIIATVNSEVVSKTTNKGNADYREILQHMDLVFGSITSVDDTMEMYAKFRDTENLLFKTTSLYIRLPSQTANSTYIQNYKKLFESVDKCSPNSSSHILSSIFLVILVAIANIIKN